MTVIDEQGRPEPAVSANEITSVLGFLEYQRATLEWKCSGVDAAGLRSTVAASSMTLGGLLKHMAFVEDHWFTKWLRGSEPSPPWDTVDWEADRDWDWNTAADNTSDELFELWRESVSRSRAAVDAALVEGGLGQPAARESPDGRSPSLRWILLHMIEEYARHNGHADILREAVDGATGE